jgi:hypothetical protein
LLHHLTSYESTSACLTYAFFFFVDIARDKGITFVAIDCNWPLVDQGPFHVILHKVILFYNYFIISCAVLIQLMTILFCLQISGKEWGLQLEVRVAGNYPLWTVTMWIMNKGFCMVVINIMKGTTLTYLFAEIWEALRIDSEKPNFDCSNHDILHACSYGEFTKWILRKMQILSPSRYNMVI